MTEKRYFKKTYEEEYYIFDSETISEKEFEEKYDYEDYKAFEDSMMGDEVVNRLNDQHCKITELETLIKDKNTTQQETLNKLLKTQKENQNIKNTIQTMMDNERTHIGYNVLKQLWLAIQ